MRPEARLNTEPAVEPLLLGPKERRRLGHRNDLGPVNVVAVPTDHDGRRAGGKHVLQPVGALTVGERNVDGAAVVNSDNRGLVRLPGLAADVTHDSRAGALLARRAQSERTGDLGQLAKAALNWPFIVTIIPRCSSYPPL